MRAGNANAAPMNANAFGGTIHADPIKQFLKSLLENNYLSNREMPNVETATLTISRITGHLPAENAPTELQTSTMGYINSLPTTADEPIIEIEYDAQCLGIASPMTPNNEIKRGYAMTNLTSFMPSQMDLEDIKEYLKNSAKATPEETTGAKTAITSFNILLEIPINYCENRQPSLSEATIINIFSPQDDRATSFKPELMYSIKSDGNLKTLTAFLDENIIRTKNITNNTREELGSTILDLSAFTPGKHQLTVQATNTKGFMNRKIITITVQSTDKEPPYYVREQSKVVPAGEEGRTATLVFNDHLSAIVGGTISAQGEKLIDFSGRLANFTTTAQSIEVEVRDSYDNVFRETISLIGDPVNTTTTDA